MVKKKPYKPTEQQKLELRLLLRIEELERKVKELEARPPIVINNQPPTFAPYPPLYQPYEPPGWPTRWGEITCAAPGVSYTHG